VALYEFKSHHCRHLFQFVHAVNASLTCSWFVHSACLMHLWCCRILLFEEKNKEKNKATGPPPKRTMEELLAKWEQWHARELASWTVIYCYGKWRIHVAVYELMMYNSIVQRPHESCLKAGSCPFSFLLLLVGKWPPFRMPLSCVPLKWKGSMETIWAKGV